MNVLIINSHQAYPPKAQGGLNSAIQGVIKDYFVSNGNEVDITKVEDGYDVNKEVDKHVWADLIIIQSPVYWFGLPWIGKKYIDEVFNVGLASKKMCVIDGRTREDPSKQYGTGGVLHGRRFMLSLTWNAPREAFGDMGQNLTGGKSVDDMFYGIGVCYKFCGIEIVPSFSFFNVYKNPDFENQSEMLIEHLKKHF